MKAIAMTRFQTRLTKEQKDLFEYAAKLGGYSTLTEFVVVAVQERAKIIIEDQGDMILTIHDQEIFFNEIINPTGPNKALETAANRYN
jgi:uncharacterized protein (DUF1778 family)